ncbi:MAG: carboxypeptidase-like regulatory domain-containing protein [Methanococcaceae archaeon]
MKKLILSILIFCNVIAAFGQIIKGTIFDKETGKIIDYAAIYLSGTFVGTNTDKGGNFQLDISKNASMPLSVSAVGYSSVTLNNFSTTEPLTIYLTTKIYNLNEVIISAKSHAGERRANLILFKNIFLGTTFIAKRCKILNENDITFNYDSDKDTLRAYTTKPLQIENRLLGYKITYFLDQFEYDRENATFFYEGNIIFNEEMTSVESQKKSFERVRKDVYIGSRMHFFRELCADNLKAAGFLVQDQSKEKLSYKKLVVEESDHKYLSYKGNLTISYYSKVNKSQIVFLKDRVFFDNTGYFDASGLSWEGQMGTQRVGEVLPYEYALKY